MIQKLKSSDEQFTHIIHVADIHIRLVNRLNEYMDVFKKFYLEVDKSPKSSVICILGDLFHNKADLSPECISLAKDFLFNCASRRPTILISGNHDALLNNKNRMDSLTPIVYKGTVKNNKKETLCDDLYYLKDTGLYGFGNILFNNYSVFSDPDKYIQYKDIPNNYKNEYTHHISLYHGPIDGVMSDLGYAMVNKAIPASIFNGHHISLLGDIHKKQDVQLYSYKHSLPAIHYPGSMIQQNHSEPVSGHGYSLWDLKTKTYTHINIPNDYGFYTVEVNKGVLTSDLKDIPKKAVIRVKCFESVSSEIKEAVATIKKMCSVEDVSYFRVDSPNDVVSTVKTTINLTDLKNIDYQNKLLTDYLKNKHKIEDVGKVSSVLQLNKLANDSLKGDVVSKNIRWVPKKFEFSNMFSYGEDNVVDFSTVKDVLGLFAPNASGKSSLMSALSFCIFDKFDRGYKAVNVLNVAKTSFKCKFNFQIDGVDYFIERKGVADRKGAVKVDVKFWKDVNGEKTELTGEARRNTNDVIKDYLGSYEDFVLTSLSLQSGKNVSAFIDMGQSDRKDLLSQFIGLDIFDRLLESATENYKEVSATLKVFKKENHQETIDTHESRKVVLDMEHHKLIDELNKALAKKTEIQEEILKETKKLSKIDCTPIDLKHTEALLQSVLKSLSTNKDKKENFVRQCAKIEETVVDCKKKLDNIDFKILDEKEKLCSKLKRELDQINRKIEIKKVEIGDRIRKIKLLENHKYDPNCKYCVENKFVKDAKKAESELVDDRVVVTELLAEKEKLSNSIDNLSSIENEISKYNELNFLLNSTINSKLKLELDIKSIESEISKTESLVKKYEEDINNYRLNESAILENRKIDQTIAVLKLDFKKWDVTVNDINKRILECESSIKLCNSEVVRLKQIIDEVKKLEIMAESYSLYLQAVSRDGIPYNIIELTAPVIEKHVNDILHQIVDFSVKIEMDTKNVNPYIVYEDRKWSIELASGFEKFVAGLAIRVALINISNLPRPNFIVIDEGWGTMDRENLSQVKILFQFLKTNFDFVLIISHLDSIKDAVDKLLEIKKENGFSHINHV